MQGSGETTTGDFILVVEDDSDSRESIQDALEAEGYRVLTAVHGKDAFDRLRGLEAKPSLILLDLMMPVMSGGEFLALLRKSPEWAQVPVVVVSAWADEAAKIAHDAQGFVKKPISLATLVEAAERFCRRNGNAGEAA